MTPNHSANSSDARANGYEIQSYRKRRLPRRRELAARRGIELNEANNYQLPRISLPSLKPLKPTSGDFSSARVTRYPVTSRLTDGKGLYGISSSTGTRQVQPRDLCWAYSRS